MELVLDIENTISHPYEDRPNEIDGSPFNSDNKLVSVGVEEVTTGNNNYYIFNHVELDLDGDESPSTELQKDLDNTTLLIGHGIKHDLMWLRECGFKYNGAVWDTMIAEYVLAKGRKLNLSLAGSCIRNNLEEEKSDILKEYFSKGFNTDEVPLQDLVQYGKQDVVSTKGLYLHQRKRIKDMGAKGTHLMKAINLMNDFLPVVTDMERAGVALDIPLLHGYQASYTKELLETEKYIKREVAEMMGDTPINIGSPDDMCKVLYSRSVLSKKDWKELFNIGTEQRGSVRKKKQIKKYSNKKFAEVVHWNTEVCRKTVAKVCPTCNGRGTIDKFKKDGTLYKRRPKCPECNGTGVIYKNTNQIAGLNLTPVNLFATQSGFASGQEQIQWYLENKKQTLSDESKKFLGMVYRRNKLSSWCDTFIAQLLKYGSTGLIHASFNQCITATGRLSGSRPNLQNQPKRDKDFKIRRAFISRWKEQGGKLFDADFGQLEFRVAAYLSQCSAAMKAIDEGLDIHTLTMKFYHGELEIKPPSSMLDTSMSRQDAKAETFGPLYGKITAWTDMFYKLFPGIHEWHKSIMNEVLDTKELASPSGRVYAFPDASLFVRRDGTRLVTGHTQIKNYIVQGFATGDMVLLVLIDLYNFLKEHKAKSRLVLQVHDSATVDAHPDEFELVKQAFEYAFGNVYTHAKQRFDININVPLAFDLTGGNNWLDQEEIIV